MWGQPPRLSSRAQRGASVANPQKTLTPQPERGQNKIVLGDGTTRNSHALRASHNHCPKAYPGAEWESMAAWAYPPSPAVDADIAGDAGTARVFAHWRKA
jgi:hypothetical protein